MSCYQHLKEWRAKNPEKWKAQRKRYKQRHPEKVREWRVRHRVRIKGYEKERRIRLARWLDEYTVACGCAMCGLDEPWCLDFHHLEPSEKEYTMSQIARVSWRRVLVEIEKCVVVCANCHRRIIH